MRADCLALRTRGPFESAALELRPHSRVFDDRGIDITDPWLWHRLLLLAIPASRRRAIGITPILREYRAAGERNQLPVTDCLPRGRPRNSGSRDLRMVP